MQSILRKLFDRGWVRLTVSFRWLFGTDYVLNALVGAQSLTLIQRRYQTLQSIGFFSGTKAVARKQRFINALFTYDAFKGSAFSLSLPDKATVPTSASPLSQFFNFIRRNFFTVPNPLASSRNCF